MQRADKLRTQLIYAKSQGQTVMKNQILKNRLTFFSETNTYSREKLQNLLSFVFKKQFSTFTQEATTRMFTNMNRERAGTIQHDARNLIRPYLQHDIQQVRPPREQFLAPQIRAIVSFVQDRPSDYFY